MKREYLQYSDGGQSPRGEEGENGRPQTQMTHGELMERRTLISWGRQKIFEGEVHLMKH